MGTGPLGEWMASPGHIIQFHRQRGSMTQARLQIAYRRVRYHGLHPQNGWKGQTDALSRTRVGAGHSPPTASHCGCTQQALGPRPDAATIH